ncbi:MAG: F0F1 ATP synthase subunit delta [Alphaproteobacteria bacterium]|nr:F0F1 ATP synthase subunit delta [Alphaproteobacteria bacterium]
MIVSGIAGRYANALFDLARDDSALDAVASDIASLGRMIGSSDDLRRLVKSPVIRHAAQASALDALMEKAEMSGLTRKFIGLVAQNRRLFALPDMIRGFAQFMARHRGEIAGEVISAHPLSAAQLAALTVQLKATVGSNVQLDAKVDASLLGGLVVKVGSRMIDSSLRTKLQNLKVAMKGAG